MAKYSDALYRKMQVMAPQALRVIKGLMCNSKDEKIRLEAAKFIAARAIPEHLDISERITITTIRASEIKDNPRFDLEKILADRADKTPSIPG